MKWKDLILILIIVSLIVLVILFWDDFIIKRDSIVSADYCEFDDDCVLAVNTRNCCSYPVPLNKEVVELDEDYVVYVYGEDYSTYSKREEVCNGVECVSAPDINNKTISCISNKCTLVGN